MTTAVLRAPPLEARRAKPVKWWAAVGVAALALLAYTWGSWLLGGDAHPTPTGIDEVPTWKVVTARSWEVLFAGWALVAIYVFLVRPWRRGRGLTVDGMLLIAWFTLWVAGAGLQGHAGGKGALAAARHHGRDRDRLGPARAH